MTKKRLLTLLKIIALPVFYAIAMRLFFGVKDWEQLYSVMSVTFLFCLPTVVGALCVYFSSEENAASIAYRIIVPWVPVFAFLLLTLIFSIEGFACWLMVLPLFLIAASIGGFIGAYIKRRNKRNNFYVSALVLLPFVMSPIENRVGAIPGTYIANTTIDITASATEVWGNVTRVKEIPAVQDKGWLTRFLGFPRPVRAELNFEGVGGYREAVFTKGLVFHEKVLEYTDKKKMVFSIKANPYEIPSTTMDEHVVIGGNYFDVLNGTYELEQLNATTCRLHLYSRFKLSTTFNFYASWWARWIMQDIQNNILQVIKKRAETK